MKTLQSYQEKKQSELFESMGVFFAFGTDQFNEHPLSQKKRAPSTSVTDPH